MSAPRLCTQLSNVIVTSHFKRLREEKCLSLFRTPFYSFFTSTSRPILREKENELCVYRVCCPFTDLCIIAETQEHKNTSIRSTNMEVKNLLINSVWSPAIFARCVNTKVE